MNCKALLMTAAAALCLAAGAAQAATAPTMTVRTGDLDLNSPKDVQRLYQRVFDAAGTVCGGGPFAFFLTGPPAEYLACREATLDAALSRFHAPLVLSLRAELKAKREAAEPREQAAR